MIVDKTIIWTSWLKLWNGDLNIADDLISPQFTAHFAPMSPNQGEVSGPEALKQWIQGARAAFTDSQFVTEVGPIADEGLIAGRWIFRGNFQGGIPGASPQSVGQSIQYYGIDILRVVDGKIVEYWLCADTLHLLQQIGVIPS